MCLNKAKRKARKDKRKKKRALYRAPVTGALTYQAIDDEQDFQFVDLNAEDVNHWNDNDGGMSPH